MQPEIRALARLCLAQVTVAEGKALRAQTFNWQLFMDLVEENAVVTKVCTALKELDIVPPDHRRFQHWLKISEGVRRDGMLRHEWALKVYQRCGEAGIPVIILKGGLLGAEVYGDPAYKRMNDVDILLREEHIEAAQDHLKSLGFASVGDLFKTAGKKAKSHHTEPFYSPDLKCILGIHWNLCSPYLQTKPDIAGIWERSVPAQIPHARRMSWEDNLLHLSVHLPFYKTGVRELADVYNVVHSAGTSLNYSVLAQRARQWHAEDAVYRVLSLADALVPIGIPHQLRGAWQAASSEFTKIDTAARLADPLALLRSRSTHVAKIEKQAVILRLSHEPREQIAAFCRKWQLFLWPPAEEVRKLAYSGTKLGWAAGVWARCRAPGRLWQAMTRDYGRKPLIAMIILNSMLCARAVLRLATLQLGGARVPELGRQMIEATE